MIGKAYRYKGLNFTDQFQHELYESSGYSYLIQDNIKDTTARTELTNRANFHGGYSSDTLANPRLLTFRGKVVGLTKEQRHLGRNAIVSAIKPEGNPNIQNRGFYPMQFQDDAGNEKFVYAKVYSPPQATNGLDDPVIEYQFELLSESEKVYGGQHVVNGSRGIIGGMTLGTTLPNKMGNATGVILVTNNGNRIAPVKFNLVGYLGNPKIYNLTNGQKYRLNGLTQNFVLDNRNLNNNPLESLIVTDQGLNVKAKRNSGADIFLEPGVNRIVITADNLDNAIIDVNGNLIYDVNGQILGYDGEDTTYISITFNDTYIY